VEFYFSDKNYHKDKFLKELASKDDQRWIEVAELLKFNRMKQLAGSVDEISAAVFANRKLDTASY